MIIRSNITTKQGDEFAPLSPALKRDLGLTQRQVYLARVEATKRRQARALAAIDAADRHAEITRLARGFRPRPTATGLAPWLLAGAPLAAGILIALAMAGLWR
jgi:anti-sigma factor RsiW